MKKIGFVDFFIDEWHSNNYIPWINELCKQYGYDFEVSYAWAQMPTYEGKMSTADWCEKNGITQCETIDELCEKSDYIMILAPANPETHLEYAKSVLKYKKNTYIDKTFAPDLKTAEEIFKIGKEYGTPFFSTSALRYGDELLGFENCVCSMSVRGGGRSFEEYCIHQIEMLVKVMKVGAEKVKVFGNEKQKNCIIKYKDGREGFLLYSEKAPFSVDIEKNDATAVYSEINSDYFKNLLKSILEFFESGVLPFESEETLEVIGIRDALIKAIDTPDEWVNIY